MVTVIRPLGIATDHRAREREILGLILSSARGFRARFERMGTKELQQPRQSMDHLQNGKLARGEARCQMRRQRPCRRRWITSASCCSMPRTGILPRSVDSFRPTVAPTTFPIARETDNGLE